MEYSQTKKISYVGHTVEEEKIMGLLHNIFNNAYSWQNRHSTKYGVSFFNTAVYSNITDAAVVFLFTRFDGQNKEKRKCRPSYSIRV
jgi:hypothetical protein